MRNIIILAVIGCFFCAGAQEEFRVQLTQVATNRDVTVRTLNAASPYLTLERSTNVGKWDALSTLKTPATDFVDTGGAYRDQGFLPEAFRNFLALLGWSPGDDSEKMSTVELIQRFSLDPRLE